MLTSSVDTLTTFSKKGRRIFHKSFYKLLSALISLDYGARRIEIVGVLHRPIDQQLHIDYHSSIVAS